ncbi:ComEC/Rec2 family competence protein [Psychrobacter sp. 72-O-c]|uniref:ComEC/Rec2 family competence protein n=1 Tax=Psychrobacter sp. 72-O-c TaxID=2774125 RepID=UPI001D104B78|nr:ComEC/Rec2 family competence protein [Psychrobacter sp. 72-O-c]
MIGALAVANSIALPFSLLLENMATVSIGLLLLITITIILALITQRSALSSGDTNKLFYQNSSQSSYQHSSESSPHNSLPIFSFSLRILRYSLIAILAVVLIVGSALQALVSYQQAEATAINEPMRVKALVTIEGVSDSIYDPTTNSGYRQVATIQHLSPLVSALTTQDLNNATTNYIENVNNSLSSNNSNNNSDESIKYRLLLNAYPKKPSEDTQIATVNDLQPGDQLFMTLALAPLATSQQAINNPSGFDSYRWLRSRHLDGVATIITVGTPIAKISNSQRLMTSPDSYLKHFRTSIDQGRWQLRQHFYQEWLQKTTAEQQAKAVTLSLLTGDRSLINRDTKDLYQLAGISHLLAISGTHVLFLAIMLAGAAVLLVDRISPILYRYIPRWQVRWLVMISAAFIYALFTGFDVPAARTAWMLLAVGAVRLTLLPVSTMRVLLGLAVLMAWFDPYVLWQAGYWLSFIAVALILKYDNTLQTQNKTVVRNRQQQTGRYKSRVLVIQIGRIFKRLFKLQCWLFIALLPLTLLLFGKASLWGLVINLFAIGLFGWVIVPLNLLAGLCYLLLPVVADSIWALVSAIVAGLHELIIWLTTLPSLKGAWLYTPVNTGILLMALLVMLPWLLPRGLISRWLALPPLTLLTMTIYANQQALSLTPTLYVLPTGDRYLSAAVLQYPVADSEIDDSKTKDISTNKGNKRNKLSTTDSVSWLFLADHRGDKTRTMPSSLTADKLSATLEQQLRTLSIKRLAGIIVQTSSVALTDTLVIKNERDKKKRDNAKDSASELLPMIVSQLSQRLPTSQYWQAGRSDQWSTLQQVYVQADQSKERSIISAQSCEQGKTWQLANGDLTLKAETGWPTIKDVSVWDCTVAIDSNLPIKIVQYNATDPQRSPRLAGQVLNKTAIPIINNAAIKDTKQLSSQQRDSKQKYSQTAANQTRIILDVATHQRVWQLWSLLCTAKPFSINNTSDNSVTWLSHSTSQVSAEVLSVQRVGEVITYDDKPLKVALTLGVDDAERQTD